MPIINENTFQILLICCTVANVRFCALSVVGLGTFKFLYLLLSDSEDESSGPKKNVNQLGILSGICLDSVYLNYLQEKAKNPPKKAEESNPKKKSRRRASIKPSTSTPLLSAYSSPRRNSAPKVVVTDITPESKDDTDVRNAKPKRRGRRGSLTSGQLSPRTFDSALNLRGIREDEATDSGESTNRTPTPTPATACWRRSSRP